MQRPEPYHQNLNDLEIITENGPVPLRDFSTVSADGMTEVVFRNLEQKLIQMIEGADYVIGSVAWLTSRPILEALARKRGVGIVVQKEDFLRPDIEANNRHNEILQQMYAILPDTERQQWEGCCVSDLSFAGDPTLEAVRCLGNHNADRRAAFPRSHNKFAIFCESVQMHDQWGNEENGFEEVHWIAPHPFAVWTGSFNFTRNAGMSFENAVILRNPTVVDAYYKEWGQLVALSEPLNWQSQWVAPQWRIGT